MANAQASVRSCWQWTSKLRSCGQRIAEQFSSFLLLQGPLLKTRCWIKSKSQLMKNWWRPSFCSRIHQIREPKFSAASSLFAVAQLLFGVGLPSSIAEPQEHGGNLLQRRQRLPMVGKPMNAQLTSPSSKQCKTAFARTCLRSDKLSIALLAPQGLQYRPQLQPL